MLIEFKDNKILLAYYGGSNAYGTTTNMSDKDIIVVLDDMKGYRHVIKESEKIEYFVFGKDYFIQKMEFDETVSLYQRVFGDDILYVKEPIILDKSFAKTYEKYRTRNLREFIYKYLKSVIDYYEIYIDYGLRKNMYHLYRIEEQVKYYVETGEFSTTISEEALEKMLVFKENYKSNNDETRCEFKRIIEYLKGVSNNVSK